MLFPTVSLRQVLVAMSMVGIFTVVMNGKVRFTGSDSCLTLLTSQAILENGSINLLPYIYRLRSDQPLQPGGWQAAYHGYAKKVIYNYPLGTSFLAIPVVAASKLFGLNMLIDEHDAWLQIFIAAWVCMGVFLLVYKIAAEWMDEYSALLVALALSFGTTFISTLGTALWSFDFEVLFILYALLQMVRSEKNADYAFPAIAVGLSLAAAYICRPTAAIFSGLSLVWVATRRSQWLNRTATGFVIPISAFFIYSLIEFGTMVPDYYSPSYWKNSTPILQGMPALLFSPARGLFIYSPLLLVAFSGFAFRSLRKNPFYLGLAGWFLVQWVLMSRHDNWWGGWCFGPRLMTDLVPCLAVMLMMSIQAWSGLAGQIKHRIFSASFMATAVWGIYTHTFLGMFNHEAISWNDNPPIDSHPEFYAWNWNYPQFMASAKNNELKQREYEILRQARLKLQEVPENAYVLWGQPGKDLQVICNHLSNYNDPHLKGATFYNYLGAMIQKKVPTFYLTVDNKEEVESSGMYNVEAISSERDLATFLRQHVNDHVFLSVKDEAANRLSDTSRIYLREKGVLIDSLRYRGSMVVWMEKGKIAFQETGEFKIEKQFDVAGVKVDVLSAGNPWGNASRIVVHGREFSPNGRGFNCVAVNDKAEVVEAVNFDTHVADSEILLLYKATKK